MDDYILYIFKAPKSNRRGAPKPGGILPEVTIICLMQINLGILMPFFRLYELNFRSMIVINFENLHILT
jgi:hypothetical protein